MKLLKVETVGDTLIRTECEICGWSTDTSLGDAIREVIIHIIAEHPEALSTKLLYSLLRNT